MPNPVMPLTGQPQQAYVEQKTEEKRLSDGTLSEKEKEPSSEGTKVDVPQGPDLSHLTPEQQKILLDQLRFSLVFFSSSLMIAPSLIS